MTDRIAIQLREPVQAWHCLRDDVWPWVKAQLIAGNRLILELRMDTRTKAQFQSTPGIEAGRSPALLTARRRMHFPCNRANLKLAAQTYGRGTPINCVMSTRINGLRDARTCVHRGNHFGFARHI